MKINRTLWRPDTCGCELTYEWDGDVEDSERVHVLVDAKHCAEHASDSFKVGDVVENTEARAKNIKKNNSIRQALKGAGVNEEKAKDVVWRYEGEKLILTLPDEYKGKKAKAKAAVAADVEVE